MGGFLLLGLLIAVVVLAGGVAFAVALARDSRKQVQTGRQILPGVETGAPDAWAGAHTPEARMHRRLAEAMRSLRALADSGTEDVAALELRVELEQHAMAVDQRLVAASALPAGVRDRALAELEVSVSTVESAAAELASRMGRTATSSDVRGLEDLAARIRGLDGLAEGPAVEGPAVEDEGPEGQTGQATS